MENPNFWANLPATVRYSKELTSLEKLLYAEITALSNLNGECHASNGYFGKLFDKSAIWVSKCISNLKKHGFIELFFTDGFDRRIIPVYDIYGGVVEKDKGGCRKRQGGVVEKDNNNNTLTESNINSSSREKLEIKYNSLSNFGLGDENMNFEEFKIICENNKQNLQKKFFYKIGDDESFEKHIIDFWSSCEDFGKYPTDHTALRRFERFLKPHYEKQEDIKNMIIAYKKKNMEKINISSNIDEEIQKKETERQKEFDNLDESTKSSLMKKGEELLLSLTKGRQSPNQKLWLLMIKNKAINIYFENKMSIM